MNTACHWKKIALAVFTFLLFYSAHAQKTAKTADGETYLLYPNGTWKHIPKDSLAVINTPEKNIHFSATVLSHTEKPILIEHTYYTISYDEKKRAPYWTYYHLTKEHVNHDTLDRVGAFVSDPKTSAIQGNDNDYKSSGYDKGHMVPCEDMSFNETAMQETFYYSNCVPQTSKLNRGQWKNLEQLTRNWAIDNEGIDVFVGPVIKENLPTLGGSKILIPKQCYKIVLDYQKPGIKAIAFIMPNQNEALKNPQEYACSIDQVEALTGIDFFPELPDDIEKNIEATFDTSAWNWNINAHKPKAGQSTEDKVSETPANTNHTKESDTTRHENAAVQCSAITQKGERCKRMTTSPNGKCSRHGGN